mmetsp:Transcript_7738/g.17685  ORF Transcript_7738/g.17685 Transcript_7738/m.17685 type:complete len:100 (-) Transcript_7738:69-368(-)
MLLLLAVMFFCNSDIVFSSALIFSKINSLSRSEDMAVGDAFISIGFVLAVNTSDCGIFVSFANCSPRQKEATKIAKETYLNAKRYNRAILNYKLTVSSP